MVDGWMWAKRRRKSSAVLLQRAISELLSRFILYRLPLVVLVASSFDPFEIQQRFDWNDVVNPDLLKVRTNSSLYPSSGKCNTFISMHLTHFLFTEIGITTVPVPSPFRLCVSLPQLSLLQMSLCYRNSTYKYFKPKLVKREIALIYC